METKELRE